MKTLLRTLIITCFVLLNTQFVLAAEPNPTSDIVAGAEWVMRDNFKLLAYKEMVRITPLLISDPVQYIAEYERIEDVYRDYLGQPNDIANIYSEDDLNYLYRCVETETHGCQIFIDKVHVANVILNRVKDDSEKFPNTIVEVVTSPGQFAYSKTNIDPLTIAACQYAYLYGDTTNGALWFHSGSKKETFSGGSYLFTDEIGHHYYR